MHIKSMEEYKNANQRYIAQITQNMMEELAEKKISDHKLLDSCMTYLKNMQKTMVELNSTLDFFTELSETGEPNEAYLEWLKSTVTFLQDTERDFIYMISSTSDTYDGFIEKVVPITETREPGIITLDVGIYLPNALKSKAKQINITAKLLDIAFEKQIKKQDEHWSMAVYLAVTDHTDSEYSALVFDQADLDFTDENVFWNHCINAKELLDGYGTISNDVDSSYYNWMTDAFYYAQSNLKGIWDCSDNFTICGYNVPDKLMQQEEQEQEKEAKQQEETESKKKKKKSSKSAKFKKNSEKIDNTEN